MNRLCLLITALLFSTCCWPDWVEAEGYAPLSAGRHIARRQALVDAYRQAISEGGLVQLDSYSQVSNFQMLSDMVNTRSHGFIRQYQVLDEGDYAADAGLYRVRIKAMVVKDLRGEGQDEQALSAFVEMIGRPRLLFLAAPDPDSAGVSRLEAYLAERFRQIGYEVMTADDLSLAPEQQASLEKARGGAGAQAALIGRLADADIVLVGEAREQSNTMTGGTDVAATLSIVNLAVKALVPGNGKVIDVKTTQERFMSLQQDGALAASQRALKKAAIRLADELKWKIPDYLSRQPREIQLEVVNLAFEQIDAFSARVKALSGIEMVKMQRWTAQQTTFLVGSGYTGPKEKELLGALLTAYPQAAVISIENYQIKMAL